uniref:WW domain-containing protein n=1 Tax=Macrostomum lignano TaxID=282301 RepID=A0A1I8J5R4_9PLAT
PYRSTARSFPEDNSEDGPVSSRNSTGSLNSIDYNRQDDNDKEPAQQHASVASLASAAPAWREDIVLMRQAEIYEYEVSDGSAQQPYEQSPIEPPPLDLATVAAYTPLTPGCPACISAMSVTASRKPIVLARCWALNSEPAGGAEEATNEAPLVAATLAAAEDESRRICRLRCDCRLVGPSPTGGGGSRRYRRTNGPARPGRGIQNCLVTAWQPRGVDWVTLSTGATEAQTQRTRSQERRSQSPTSLLLCTLTSSRCGCSSSWEAGPPADQGRTRRRSTRMLVGCRSCTSGSWNRQSQTSTMPRDAAASQEVSEVNIVSGHKVLSSNSSRHPSEQAPRAVATRKQLAESGTGLKQTRQSNSTGRTRPAVWPAGCPGRCGRCAPAGGCGRTTPAAAVVAMETEPAGAPPPADGDDPATATEDPEAKSLAAVAPRDAAGAAAPIEASDDAAGWPAKTDAATTFDAETVTPVADRDRCLGSTDCCSVTVAKSDSFKRSTPMSRSANRRSSMDSFQAEAGPATEDLEAGPATEDLEGDSVLTVSGSARLVPTAPRRVLNVASPSRLTAQPNMSPLLQCNEQPLNQMTRTAGRWSDTRGEFGLSGATRRQWNSAGPRRPAVAHSKPAAALASQDRRSDDIRRRDRHVADRDRCLGSTDCCSSQLPNPTASSVRRRCNQPRRTTLTALTMRLRSWRSSASAPGRAAPTGDPPWIPPGRGGRVWLGGRPRPPLAWRSTAAEGLRGGAGSGQRRLVPTAPRRVLNVASPSRLTAQPNMSPLLQCNEQPLNQMTRTAGRCRHPRRVRTVRRHQTAVEFGGPEATGGGAQQAGGCVPNEYVRMAEQRQGSIGLNATYQSSLLAATSYSTNSLGAERRAESPANVAGSVGNEGAQADQGGHQHCGIRVCQPLFKQRHQHLGAVIANESHHAVQLLVEAPSQKRDRVRHHVIGGFARRPKNVHRRSAQAAIDCSRTLSKNFLAVSARRPRISASDERTCTETSLDRCSTIEWLTIGIFAKQF